MYKDKSKRIALIAPIFFGYYKDIIEEANSMGFQVDYFCDTPSNSNISKAIGRINKKFLLNDAKKYFEKSILPLFKKTNYQFVLLVAGMTFAYSPQMINQIKQIQKGAKFVMYQWDSEKNLPYSIYIHQFFDSIFTFDRFDAIRDSKYLFLPLFYTRKYEELGKKNSENIEYDCMYVGTAHPKKYYEINQMSEILRKVYKRQFIYHYMPSYLKYIYHKIFAKEYKNAKWSDFETKKLSVDEITYILAKSRCVLDAPQGGQVGLTIRTFECLASNKKMITTNSDVVNYDFYDPQNILLFSENIDFASPFFTEKYRMLPAEIYEKYSLYNWLSILLS